jgi:23S rRNA G2445 N2-methylase RlmL
MASAEKEGRNPSHAVIARHPLTLSMKDVYALCDRLQARAETSLAQTQYTSDQKLAAAVMRVMWERAFHSSDQLTVSI